MKKVNELTREEAMELLDTPRTQEYKQNFWHKIWMNENILNPNKPNRWEDDVEFCKRHEIRFV